MIGRLGLLSLHQIHMKIKEQKLTCKKEDR